MSNYNESHKVGVTQQLLTIASEPLGVYRLAGRTRLLREATEKQVNHQPQTRQIKKNEKELNSVISCVKINNGKKMMYKS